METPVTGECPFCGRIIDSDSLDPDLLSHFWWVHSYDFPKIEDMDEHDFAEEVKEIGYETFVAWCLMGRYG